MAESILHAMFNKSDIGHSRMKPQLKKNIEVNFASRSRLATEKKKKKKTKTTRQLKSGMR